MSVFSLLRKPIISKRLNFTLHWSLTSINSYHLQLGHLNFAQEISYVLSDESLLPYNHKFEPVLVSMTKQKAHQTLQCSFTFVPTLSSENHANNRYFHKRQFMIFVLHCRIGTRIKRYRGVTNFLFIVNGHKKLQEL